RKILGENRDLANDPELRKMVEESLAGQTLTDDDRKKIEQWKQNLAPDGPKLPPQPHLPHNPPIGPKAPPPTPQPLPPPNPRGAAHSPATAGAESLPQETPDWLKKGLASSARDFSKWLDSPSGKSFRDSLKDLGKQTGELRNSPAGDRARTATQRLPKPG